MGKKLLTIFGFAFLFAAPLFAAENGLLARVTVYWPGEGQGRACFNGARLRAGHCAVDPKRIPFGSRVLFPDAICTAVDSGPAVVSRKAARITGRTAAQQAALVIDRFFESKQAALDWEKSHPHFMTVRVMPPGSHDEASSKSKVGPSSLPKFDSAKLRLGLPLNSILGPAQRRT
ncbi:MAG TPA: hypothetical protein VH170_08575 [Chthoniobacterales bacterium]|jgi:3D (Asp-Asp-Asp) domain-containing protein|nr:hypothetical protein [Chthoniobacterales bacterium]